MKKLLATPFFASLAITTLLSSAPLAMADTQTFATVNIQQILRDSTAAKSVHDQMESKAKSFHDMLSKKVDTLQKEEQELNKQKSVLSKSAFDEKAGPLLKRETEIQRDDQSKRAILQNAGAQAGADIQKAVTEIVADLAKEKGFTLALAAEGPTSPVLYADSKYDITGEVLARLNKKLPSLDVKFEADAAATPAKSKK